MKPIYNDHLIWYFSALWILSRWPLVTQNELRKAKVVSKNNNGTFSLHRNTLLNKSRTIHFIIQVVVTDRCHSSAGTTNCLLPIVWHDFFTNLMTACFRGFKFTYSYCESLRRMPMHATPSSNVSIWIRTFANISVCFWMWTLDTHLNTILIAAVDLYP